jgi:uncharacterized damage-inducible protein DinB
VSEIQFIVGQLRAAFDGEAWHGPALMEILNGVDAPTAAARPVASAHSIWELVMHIAAWERVIAHRITTRQVVKLSDEQNFPATAQATESAWQESLKNLRSAHSEIIAVVSQLPEARLNEQVPGKDYDIRFMLTGAVQHAAYHGGQIALLKKALS